MSTCTTPVGFKSGKDLGEETSIADEETITCVDCGATDTQESAYDGGWQLDPPVCPNCLRWCAVADASCCAARPS
jgi:hypothetical protein